MNRKTLIQLRDEDFTECLRSTILRHQRERRDTAAAAIISEALASRPRRYYLAYSTVSTQLSRLRGKGHLKTAANRKSTLARSQWADISSAVDRYLCRNKRATIGEAITHVVNFERPKRFYISDKRARELFRCVSRRTYSLVG